MARHAGGAPTQRGPMERTSAVAEEKIDMLDVDRLTVGPKHKNLSDKDNDKEDPIKVIGSCCKKILADVEKATKEIEWTDWREGEGPGGERTEAPDPTIVDSCLAHFVLAKQIGSISTEAYGECKVVRLGSCRVHGARLLTLMSRVRSGRGRSRLDGGEVLDTRVLCDESAR
ncbi:hypothetical protein HPB51_012545 [Rhipicephalus microplus]|uniref:Uncharacterized protein n=1 Tax=Rhipicephalus microplus TaxID=6941 RepID=A0A9J6DGW7_RHIMP|nr:hypothetical protein HPB51_012545 [Rhipicephalus microplus]